MSILQGDTNFIITNYKLGLPLGNMINYILRRSFLIYRGHTNIYNRDSKKQTFCNSLYSNAYLWWTLHNQTISFKTKFMTSHLWHVLTCKTTSYFELVLRGLLVTKNTLICMLSFSTNLRLMCAQCELSVDSATPNNPNQRFLIIGSPDGFTTT